MSIVAALNPQAIEEERRRKNDQLLESIALIGRNFGLSDKEVLSAVAEVVRRKTLVATELSISKAIKSGVVK